MRDLKMKIVSKYLTLKYLKNINVIQRCDENSTF